MAKIITKFIDDAAVTNAKLNADVAGNGISGGAGSALAVSADATGGANLATAINVSANGVAIKVDDDTIGINGSSQLIVKANSIGAAELDETDNYAFSGTVTAVTQSAGDNSTNVATTAYVDNQVSTQRRTAGNGLSDGAGQDLDVNVDDSTIEINADTLRVKADGINATHIDETTNYTWTGTHDYTGGTVTVATPTLDNHAVNKAYADSISSGLDPKESVRVATTAVLANTMVADDTSPSAGERAYNTTNKTITWATGEGPTTIDGITLANGDRILVKDESATSGPSGGNGVIYNGIYVRTSADVWTRATDHDGTPSNEVSGGNFTFVELGTANENSGWVLQGDGILTLQTDDISFVQFSGAGSITAGTGLSKTGNTINFNATDASLTVSADDVAVNIDTGIVLNAGGIGVDLEAAGSGTGGLAFNGNEIRVDVASGLELTASGVAVDLEAAGVGTGGLVFNGNEIRVDVASGLELTASGVGVDLEAAGVGTGGLELNGNEIRVDAGNGIELTATGVAVNLEAAGAGTGGLAFDAGELRVDAGDGIVLDATGVAVDLTHNFTWTGTHDYTGATITAPTQTQGDNSTNVATTAYVDTAVTGLSSETKAVEMFTLNGTSDTNGVTLSNPPVSASVVQVNVVGGPEQINQVHGVGTGDFAMDGATTLRYKDGGTITGLSGVLDGATDGDVIIVTYTY